MDEFEKVKVIFTDIDGTLGFYNTEKHGITLLSDQPNPDGTFRVTDNDARAHDAFRIQSSDYTFFLSTRTHTLCHELRTQYEIVLVTGAQLESIQKRANTLNFADAFIIESGGIILDRDYREDPERKRDIELELPNLREVEQYLMSEKWKLYNKGRTASLRLRREDNPQKIDDKISDEALVEAFMAQVKLPAPVIIDSNLGYIDILPVNSGKGNGVAHYQKTHDKSTEESIGIGDDINDESFLNDRVSERYVLASADASLIKRARYERWFVSEKKHIEGINEILEEILRRQK